MSAALILASEFKLTESQLELIKTSVAKGASDDELKLFLYRCQNLGLDPLKPGQIHFVKYKDSPGAIVVGIDGLRTIAAKTGKHNGTKRGILRDAKGQCVGGWAEVFRHDWTHPAREEVPFKEYDKKRNSWITMPETMIKKVAEAAALRMAFPDQLSGVYSDDEIQTDQDKITQLRSVTSSIVSKDESSHDLNSHPINAEQQKRIFALAKTYKWSLESLKDLLMREFRLDYKKALTFAQCEKFCSLLEIQGDPHIDDSAIEG